MNNEVKYIYRLMNFPTELNVKWAKVTITRLVCEQYHGKVNNSNI